MTPNALWPNVATRRSIQAYEQGDEIVLELIVYDDPAVMDALLLERLRSGAPIGVTPCLVRYRLRGRSEAAIEPIDALQRIVELALRLPSVSVQRRHLEKR